MDHETSDQQEMRGFEGGVFDEWKGRLSVNGTIEGFIDLCKGS
jgi:hypothetical protein